MDKFSYRLEGFEGPLDLLLFLISKNKLNICDIRLTVLVDQYLEQIRAMQERDMDIASEFLEMASRLIYLKTVSLLPRHEEAEELKQQLQTELMAYDRCRRIAAVFATMTGGFDTFVKTAEPIEYDKTYVDVHESDVLVDAYIAAVGRGKRRLPPPTTAFTKIVAHRIVSVSSRIVSVLAGLRRHGRRKVRQFFEKAESRSDLIATFLAILELCKGNRVTIQGEGKDAEVTMNGNDFEVGEDIKVEYQ